MIDISQEDFGTLCICALRYCHGRQTYMPSLVQEIVQNHFKDLSEKDLKIIAACSIQYFFLMVMTCRIIMLSGVVATII